MQRFCVARRGFWKEWPISWLAEFSWRRHKNQWTSTFYLLSIFFVPGRSVSLLSRSSLQINQMNGGTMGLHNEGPAQSNPITLSFSKNLFSSFVPSFAHCRLALFLLCFFKALKSLLSATASQAERSIISYCTSMRYYCPLFSHFSLLSCHRYLF